MYLIFNRQIVIVCGVCRVSRENILPLPLPWIIVAVGILLLFLLVILSCVVHRIRRRSKYFFCSTQIKKDLLLIIILILIFWFGKYCELNIFLSLIEVISQNYIIVSLPCIAFYFFSSNLQCNWIILRNGIIIYAANTREIIFNIGGHIE